MNILEEMDIDKLSYPDFVGATGQENTPPGGKFTIDYWCALGDISQDSMLLDLACSTGFSSRMCAAKADCGAYGIDLSKVSIHSATSKSIENSKLSYLVGDTAVLPFRDNLFTHVLGGCNFGFIQNREASLDECSRVLKNQGKLLIATHFYKTTPEESILDDVNKAINFRPCSHWTQDWWVDFFETHFTLKDINVVDLPVMDEEKIRTACVKIIEDQVPTVSKDRKQQLVDRLTEIRLVLNKHREYQSFFQAVFEKK